LYPLKAPAALGTLWPTQPSGTAGERIEDSWHSVHRIRMCIPRTKRPVSPGGLVFFHSQHRRRRFVVHPFCFCPRSSSLSMIRRTSSATERPFSLAIFSKAAFCGSKDRCLFVRIPCRITYTNRSGIVRTVFNGLRLAYPALKCRACARHWVS